MIEPTVLDYALVAALGVALPLMSALVTVPKVRKLPRDVQHALRPQLYVQAMVSQWIFAVAALQAVLWRDYPWEVLGLGVPRWPAVGIGLALLIALGVAILLARRGLMRQEESAAQVREALEPVQWVLPRGTKQRRLWWVVSAHAGWGEELFYRGYLFALLSALMPPLAAGVVSTLMFGAAHMYQGVRGIVVTSLLGGVFMGLYVVSGTLLVPMIAHALYDIHAGELGYWAFAKDDTPAHVPNDQ